jgi:tetratricopeptide (TPR) repeat protein
MDEPVTAPIIESVEPEQGASLLAEGRAHYAEAHYQEALSCLHLAYDARLAALPGDRGENGDLAEIANDLGVVYTVLERWNEAEKWLNEAQQRFVLDGDLGGEAQTLGNMGSMYRVRGNLGQAAAHLWLSAERFHLVGDETHRAASLRMLCLVRLRQFRFLEAVDVYRKVLACQPNPNLLVKLLQRLFDLPAKLLERQL